MSKSKHGKKDEHHLGVIRAIKKEVKSLRQQVRQLQKYEQKTETKYKIIAEPSKPKFQMCSNCKDGWIIERKIAGRLIDECSSCGKRSAAKKTV